MNFEVELVRDRLTTPPGAIRPRAYEGGTSQSGIRLANVIHKADLRVCFRLSTFEMGRIRENGRIR